MLIKHVYIILITHSRHDKINFFVFINFVTIIHNIKIIFINNNNHNNNFFIMSHIIIKIKTQNIIDQNKLFAINFQISRF